MKRPTIPNIPPQLRQLLDDYATVESAPNEQSVRLHRRIEQSITSGSAARIADTVMRSPEGLWPRVLRSRYFRELLVFGVGLGLGATARGWLADQPPGTPPPTVAAGPPPAPPRVAPAPPVVIREARPKPATDLEGRDAALALERQLVTRGRTALGRKSYADALAAAREHEQKFPAGRLIEEREMLLIQALWGLGERDAAQERAGDFRRRFPNSLLLPALDRRLEQTP